MVLRYQVAVDQVINGRPVQGTAPRLSALRREGDRWLMVAHANFARIGDRPEIPAWNRRSGTGWLDRPRGAGIEPATVDAAFCTHLHVDHVGWNVVAADGSWAATFPNARYLVGRR